MRLLMLSARRRTTKIDDSLLLFSSSLSHLLSSSSSSLNLQTPSVISLDLNFFRSPHRPLKAVRCRCCLWRPRQLQPAPPCDLQPPFSSQPTTKAALQRLPLLRCGIHLLASPATSALDRIESRFSPDFQQRGRCPSTSFAGHVLSFHGVSRAAFFLSPG